MTTQKRSKGYSVIVLDDEGREIPDNSIDCESLEHAYAVVHQMLASGKIAIIVNAKDNESQGLTFAPK